MKNNKKAKKNVFFGAENVKTFSALKFTYEPEADVLRVELSKKPFFNVIEFGNFIIHIDKEQKPIYLEIFSAKDFLIQSNQTILSKSFQFKKDLTLIH